MYKLLALDMDGTLLKNDGTISNKTKEALNYAKSKNIKIVIATGRPIQGVMNYIKELNLIGNDEYVLAYNGSAVYNTKSLKPILHNGLLGKEAKDIFNLSRKLDAEFHGFTDECCIAVKENIYTEGEKIHNHVPVKIIDFQRDLNDDDLILKVMIMENEKKLNEIVKKIPSEFFERYNCVRSTSFMFEFMNKACSKSVGLSELALYLNINKNEIIAFGDAENDIDMIEYAGLGVAMGNASNLVKSRADYITLSNEEDGIAEVIYELL